MNPGPHDDDQISRNDAESTGAAGTASSDAAKSGSQTVDRAVRDFVEELRRRHEHD